MQDQFVALVRAQAILEDFTRFWDAEPEPAERRKLILSLFAQVWAKDDKIGAVKPNSAFAGYFTAASEVRATHPKADAGDEATNTGATGLEPATSAVTGQRSNLLSYAPAMLGAPGRRSVPPQYAKAGPSAPRSPETGQPANFRLGLDAWRSSVQSLC